MIARLCMGVRDYPRRLYVENAALWHQQPKFPPSHFVDSRIYTDEQLFNEEREKIFNKCWIIACHESEVPNAFDYRTFSHPGGTPLIVVRGEDKQVRSFYNVCPHRGNSTALRSRRQCQTHHVYLPRLVVRHEGELRRHNAGGTGISKALLQDRLGPARGTRGGWIRWIRFGRTSMNKTHAL